MPIEPKRTGGGGSGGDTNLTNDEVSAAMWNPVSTDWKRCFTHFEDSANYSPGYGAGGLPLVQSGTVARNPVGAGSTTDGLSFGTVGVTTATTGADGFYTGRYARSITGNVYRIGLRFKHDIATNASDQYKSGVGFDTAFLNNGTEGVFLGVDYSQNTTNYVAMSSDGGTDTVTDTGVAFDTNWHNIEVLLDAGAGTPTATYYIDGALVATHTTNIPNAGALYYQLFTLAIGTMSQSIITYMDWAYLHWKPNAALGVVHTWT